MEPWDHIGVAPGRHLGWVVRDAYAEPGVGFDPDSVGATCSLVFRLIQELEKTNKQRGTSLEGLLRRRAKHTPLREAIPSVGNSNSRLNPKRDSGLRSSSAKGTPCVIQSRLAT